MTTTEPTTSAPTFESALEQLQNTVKKLEAGELSLEEALKGFEEGVKLARFCQGHLAAAEQKVELLMKAPAGEGPAAAAGVETQPFVGTTRG